MRPSCDQTGSSSHTDTPGDALLLTGLARALFFVSLYEEELGEGVYAEMMKVLTGPVAGYVAGEEGAP